MEKFTFTQYTYVLLSILFIYLFDKNQSKKLDEIRPNKIISQNLFFFVATGGIIYYSLQLLPQIIQIIIITISFILFIVYSIFKEKILKRINNNFEIKAKPLRLHKLTSKIVQDLELRKIFQKKVDAYDSQGRPKTLNILKNIDEVEMNTYFIDIYKDTMLGSIKQFKIKSIIIQETLDFIKQMQTDKPISTLSLVYKGVIQAIEQAHRSYFKENKDYKATYKEQLKTTPKRIDFEIQLIHDYTTISKKYTIPITNLYLLARNQREKHFLGGLQNSVQSKLQYVGFKYYIYYKSNSDIAKAKEILENY